MATPRLKMKVQKTSIQKVTGGISIYQLNQYGHQRVELSENDLVRLFLLWESEKKGGSHGKATRSFDCRD